MARTLQVGDEEAFLSYEEKVVYDLQKAWSGKSGMDGLALMDTCAKLEDLIYNDALKEYNLSSTANVWSKRECISYFQEKCDVLLRNLESKELNWKKLFEESRMNTRQVLNAIMKADGDRKFKNSADAYKSASRALMPKARKSTMGLSEGRESTAGPKKKPGPKQTTGKRGRVPNAKLSLQASSSFTEGLNEYLVGGEYGSQDNTSGNQDEEGGEQDMSNLLAGDHSLEDLGFDFEEDGPPSSHQYGEVQQASLAVDDEAWMS